MEKEIIKNDGNPEKEVAARPLDSSKIANAGAMKKGTTIDSDDKMEDNKLNDPVAFWKSWSERKAYCDNGNHDGRIRACNCFEGVGTVM